MIGPSRKGAEKVIAKRKAEIAENKFLDKRKEPDPISFYDFAKDYLQWAKANKKASSYDRDLYTTRIFPLRVLATIKGDHKKEKLLHRKFRKEMLEREWFRPSEKIIQYIQTLEGNQLSCLTRFDGEKLLTPLEMADVIKFKANRVLILVNKGRIPYVKVKGMVYFKPSKIKEWMENLQMSLNPLQEEAHQDLTPQKVLAFPSPQYTA